MHGVSLVDGLVYTFSLLVTIGVTINSDADLASVLVTSLYILVGVSSLGGFLFGYVRAPPPPARRPHSRSLARVPTLRTRA